MTLPGIERDGQCSLSCFPAGMPPLRPGRIFACVQVTLGYEMGAAAPGPYRAHRTEPEKLPKDQNPNDTDFYILEVDSTGVCLIYSELYIIFNFRGITLNSG